MIFVTRLIVGSDRVRCTVRHAARACVRSLEMVYSRGSMWTHPRIVPYQNACFLSSRGGSISYLFFAKLYLDFSHPLPRTVWLRNKGYCAPAAGHACIYDSNRPFGQWYNRIFICHSQSNDVPHDLSPFIDDIRCRTYFDATSQHILLPLQRECQR